MSEHRPKRGDGPKWPRMLPQSLRVPVTRREGRKKKGRPVSGHEPLLDCPRCGNPLSLADSMLHGSLCGDCRSASDKVARAEHELAEAEDSEERARKRVAKARARLEAAREEERKLANVEVPMTEERDPPTAEECEEAIGGESEPE
jgi:hypothetical protein